MKITNQDLIELLVNTSAGENARGINDHDPLRKQGIDSLDLMDFYLNIQEKYGIHIPDEDVEKLKTLTDFRVYLEAKIG